MKHLVRYVTMALLLLAATVPGAEAQLWENDVRIRAGFFIPQDLPTDSGLMLGLEFRNLLWEHDGLIYGVHYYDEQTSDREKFGTGTIDLEADIRITPFTFGWFHIFPQKIMLFTLGAGIGLYESKSFSGGATGTQQVSDVGDFRFLQDDTYFGFNFFLGADFFPESRWGVGTEVRFHIVENDFGGSEFGIGGIFRFLRPRPVMKGLRRRGAVPPGLPLVETHLHFEGSIPLRALRSLARRHRVSMKLPRAGQPLQRRRGFDAFLEGFISCVRLLRDRRDVAEAAGALFTDLHREGMAYAEVIFSPQSHLRRGLSLHDLIHGLDDARSLASGRGGPRIAFIADGGRLWGPGWMEEMVDQVAAYRKQGVVAVGLGGDERLFPARRFRKAFQQAARLGLGRVAHAGEGTPPRSVLEVLDHLEVDRIGHGIGAAGSPSLMRRLAREGILLEVCPTSNLMTGAVDSWPKHPLRRLMDAGVAVTLGSDDRTLFGTTLRGEYRAAVERCGAERGEIRNLLANGVKGSFAPAAVKRRLLAGLEERGSGADHAHHLVQGGRHQIR